MGSRDKHSGKRSRDDERSRERGSKRRSHSGSKQPNPSSQRHKRTSDVEFEMTRSAARAVRDIIRYNDGLKGEIRQLAIALDDGNALDISDIKDEYLHSKVKLLFENLPQLRKKSSGSYVCRSRSSTSVMSFVAPMLEQDVSLPEAAPKAFQPPPPKVTSPSHPETRDPSGASSPEDTPNPVIPRPVMGPAAPPRHVLEAAAVLKEQIEMEDRGAEEKKGEVDEEQSGSELIGPPPPQLEEEVDVATTDQRVGEILRIMDVLHNHNSTNDQSKAGEGRAQFSSPDAYDILGVDPLATAGEIKKRYWRLSLLTHPDKCSHPQASVAFAAVATAAQQLQNASSRGLVDKEREENELRQFTTNYVAREERERQWKSARGEKVHTAPSAQPTQTTRESWMTDVPPAFLGKSHDFGRVTTTSSRGENTKSSSIARSGQSLLEKHQANLASNKKKTSKTGNQADDWDKGAHPWRPFDRTTDLDVGNLRGRKPQEAAADFTSATAKLSSRFAPGR